MKEYYKDGMVENISSIRDKIIGLGENSIKKNYYPELQERLIELEKINLRNKALLHGIPDSFMLIDNGGAILEVHPGPNTRGGLFGEENKGRNIYEFFPTEVSAAFHSYFNQEHEKDIVIQFDFEMNFKDSVIFYEARAVKLYEDEFLFIIRDITEMHLMIERLRFLGSRDYLTGLYNRTYFEEQMLSYEKNCIKTVGIVICDVDGLKFINDTLGHKAGDQILQKTAEIISKCFREEDIKARIGGDEYAVLVHSVEEQYLVDCSEKMEAEVALFNRENDKLQMGVSVGYAYSKCGSSISKSLFQEADNKMYRKKLLRNTSIRSTIVKTLMKALEARDYITEGHAERLGNIAVQIGKSLGLSQTVLDDISLLAKFHDLGKVGIPDSILFKPGKLTADEMRIMQGHCEIGHRIASSAPELSHIANFILMHHERWNGLGYPLGLRGEDIPIECRIISIADAFDAMSNDRPYRKAMKEEDTINEIVANSGTQFDPKIIGVFQNIVNKFEGSKEKASS